MKAGGQATLEPGGAGWAWVMQVAGEWGGLALVFYAWDALAHLRWRVTDYLVVVGLWWAGNLLAQGWRSRVRVGWGWGAVVEWGAPVLGLLAWNERLKYPLTAGQLVYAGVLGAVVVAGWRGLDRWERRREPETGWAGERLRRALVVAGSLAGVAPFFTDLGMGGTDARWYAYMLADFIEQARAGVWPIFVSQGELMVAGAVHVFRSAPLYLWQAAGWDLLTGRSLGMDALQHLTVLGAMLVAGAGMYGCARSLLPTRRWSAWLVTMLYVWAPGVMMGIYLADAYMTLMAAAVAPWVVWANLRVVRRDDWARQAALGAALALSWMAHPPTAMFLTLVTAWVQGMRLIELPRWTVGALARAGVGAGVFLAAGAYYFAGMSELPKGAGEGMGEGLKLVLALFGGMLALGRATRWREWPGWAGVGLAGVWLTQNHVPWAWWGAGMVAIMGGWAWLDAARPGWKLGEWWGEAFVVAALGMAALAWQGLGETRPEMIYPSYQAWQQNHAAGVGFLGPINPTLHAHGSWTPGAGWWAALGGAMGAVVLGRRRGAIERGLWGPVLIGVTGLLGVPAAGEFFAAFGPDGLATTMGWPMHLRVVAPLTVVGAAVIAGAWGAWPRRGRGGAVALAGLVLAAGWAAVELRHIWARGTVITASRAISATNWLIERAVMDRFVYDLLKVPEYFSHGKTDPRLETRLLDAAGRVVVGPDEVARRMEEAGVEEVEVRVQPHSGSGDWLQLWPKIGVDPGEHVLLAFEFQDAEYAGYLILTSRLGRREYLLPNSGLERAFGTGMNASRVLSLWNSTPERQEYIMEVLMLPAHADELKEGVFARVRRSRYDPARAVVRMRDWMPYRAEVEVGEGAAWLETPRTFVPGYVATVDGVETPVARSAQDLVKVAVEPGQRSVEVRYAGTPRLWGGLAVSLVTWAGLAGWWAWSPRRPRAF